MLKKCWKAFFKSSFAEHAVGKILYYYIKLVKYTSHIDVQYGSGFDHDKFLSVRSGVFALWHQQIALAVMVLEEIGPALSALVSSHSDGKIIASAAKNTGCNIISGSTNKSTNSAIKSIISTLRSGGNIVITPDGPRGPREEINSNIMPITSKTGSFIIPLALSSSRYIELKSWDLFILPLPFSKISVKFESPISPVGNQNMDDANLKASLVRANKNVTISNGGGKAGKLFELLLYVLSFVIFPFQLLLLALRALRGKEDGSRILEKLAIASDVEQEDLVWIHAASVGESIVAFSIIDIFLKLHQSQKFLLTSGTKASAELIATKSKAYNSNELDQVITHQYLPIDNIFISKRFLNYWKPRLGIFVESELWPNILWEAKKLCPLILANARISSGSFARWRSFAFIIKNIATCFVSVLAQSKIDEERYIVLGFDNVELYGNLKYIQKDEKIDEDFFHKMKDATSNRQIIFAASTHEGEEKIISSIYLELKKEFKNLLLIIAPRHSGRAGEVAELLNSKGLQSVTRTSGSKILSSTDIFILDTIGEMVPIYKLMPITFMGGSFTIGGHNILEPAKYNSLIIYGPDMRNFQEISDEFLRNEAAMQARNEEMLKEFLRKVLSFSFEEKLIYTKNAQKVVISKKLIEPLYFDKMKLWL